MEDRLFELKFASKTLSKHSKKAEKEEQQEVKKAKKAMEKGNMDGARIYAENAIRKKNEAMNCLRLSSKIDAVASRVQTAIKTNMVTKTMKGIVGNMGKLLKNVDPEKISGAMDQFEKQFEDLDVATEYMETSMGSSAASATPQEEVNSLLSQIADEHGLDVKSQISVGSSQIASPAQNVSEKDELSERLARLKNL